MPFPPEECSVRFYLVDPYEIHYLRFILEAYDGVAVVTTLNAGFGLVRIAIAPGCESDVAEVLEAEREILKLRQLAPDSELMQAILEKS